MSEDIITEQAPHTVDFIVRIHCEKGAVGTVALRQDVEEAIEYSRRFGGLDSKEDTGIVTRVEVLLPQ